MKRVILCVDDFGLKPEVNEAVAELADAGVVSATGCMSQGPAWREGAGLLKGERRHRLDVGLHFNLTEPFAGAWSMPLARVIGMACVHAINPQALQRAVCTQLDAFEDAWGAAPDFVDGHQHVHQLPQVRQVLLTELQRRYGGTSHDGSDAATGTLPWLRHTRAGRDGAGVDFKQRVIEALGAAPLAQQARAAGFRLNGALWGVYGFDADTAGYAQRLRAWLARAQEGDVLMMHPATPAKAAAPIVKPGTDEIEDPIADPIADARVVEYTVLKERGGEMLAQAGVQAGRMAGIPIC